MSPIFKYHAKNVKEELKDGTIEALTKDDAVNKLKGQGLDTISIEEVNDKKDVVRNWSKLTNEEQRQIWSTLTKEEKEQIAKSQMKEVNISPNVAHIIRMLGWLIGAPLLYAILYSFIINPLKPFGSIFHNVGFWIALVIGLVGCILHNVYHNLSRNDSIKKILGVNLGGGIAKAIWIVLIGGFCILFIWQSKDTSKHSLSAEDYKNQGDAYAAKGDYNNAIDRYSNALKVDRNDWEAYQGRATFYFAIGEYEKAKSDAYAAKRLGHDPTPLFWKSLRSESAASEQKSIENK